MKFGVVTSFGSVHDYVDMARDAEASGWDGVFAWDDISVDRGDVFDPWVVLGAMAAVTERITLGAMVFSLARRRPWKVARETITIDNLSNGRFVLPVGLGGTWDGGYSRVSTDEPRAVCAPRSWTSAWTSSSSLGRARPSATRASTTG